MSHKEYDRDERTICEHCKNACGKCSWSASLLPVKGWVATPTKVRGARDNILDSFRVYYCPLFDHDDKKHTPNLNQESTAKLMFAVLRQSVLDYSAAVVKMQKKNKPLEDSDMILEIRRFFMSQIGTDMFFALGINAEPDQIWKAIERDPQGVVDRLCVSYGEELDRHRQNREFKKSQKGRE